MDRPVGAHPAAGFTLIELMVVVAILALLTTTLTLSVSRPRGADMADAKRFEAVYSQLRDEAVMSGQILGLQVDADGFQRLRWQAGAWQEVGAAADWRGAVQVIEPLDRRAPLQFAPSGQVSPVRMRFDAGEQSRTCRGDAWAGLSCSAG